MGAIKTEITKSARVSIKGATATVSRTGETIKIAYPYAGRFSTDDQYFHVSEILALAQFVADTEEPSP